MIDIRLAAIALPIFLLLGGGCADRGEPGGQTAVEQAGAAVAPGATAPAAAAAAAAGLSQLGFARGNDSAPITVVEFSDFGCPYCARFALETYPELHREFVESGQVSWRFVPFVLGSFPNGDLAARASECAGDQDQFWAMHDLLFQRQRQWKSEDEPDQLFASYATLLGLDAGRFTACYAGGATDRRTETANGVAKELGVRATPTFFINGRRFEGALPAEQFRMLLNWSGAEG